MFFFRFICTSILLSQLLKLCCVQILKNAFKFTVYSLNKTSNPEPWERLDPSKPQKVM